MPNAWKTFTLRKAVAEYCATSITESGDDTGQILKTSIFVRGTSGPFMAEHWFHALTWNLVFDPFFFAISIFLLLYCCIVLKSE